MVGGKSRFELKGLANCGGNSLGTRLNDTIGDACHPFHGLASQAPSRASGRFKAFSSLLFCIASQGEE